MEWFALGVAVVSAIAAIWSAVSSHCSAGEAKDTRRPYGAVTGNQLERGQRDGAILHHQCRARTRSSHNAEQQDHRLNRACCRSRHRFNGVRCHLSS